MAVRWCISSRDVRGCGGGAVSNNAALSATYQRPHYRCLLCGDGRWYPGGLSSRLLTDHAERVHGLPVEALRWTTGDQADGYDIQLRPMGYAAFYDPHPSPIDNRKGES